MNPAANITDEQRRTFMQALGASVRSKNGVLLPDWEGQFLASFSQSSRPSLWFTAGRRAATDRIWMRWGGEINHPHPEEEVQSLKSQVQSARPDGCEFWIKDDGRQRRCDDTASHQGKHGLRYCQAHADQVVKDMKRAGRSIQLINFP